MEKWEKEYQEIMQAHGAIRTVDSREALPEGKAVGDYWLEMSGQDGGKVFVPRMNLIQADAQRGPRRLRVFEVISRVLLVASTVVLVVLACFILRMYQEQAQNVPSAPVVSVADSFVQGKGLKHMVTELAGVRQRQTETLNRYISAGYGFIEEEMAEWLDEIDDDYVVIEHLAYDASYAGFVDAHRSYLAALEEYIAAVEAQDTEKVDAARERCSELLAGMHEVLTDALEGNGVEYEWNEDGSLRIFYVES